MEKGESWQLYLRNLNFCIEKVSAKCCLVEMKFVNDIISLGMCHEEQKTKW